MDEQLVYDQDEAVEFIQDRLAEDESFGMARGDIKTILDAEEDYMRSKGIIEL